ncbi:MAG: PepSY-associated TM helix domain-containing protein [Planctomycetota bacterium]|jgi:uncharacterized iron-regulated membrane protein
MKRLRRLIFWIHLALGLFTGLAAALMAGTAVIMAFADSYLELRESGLRSAYPAADAKPMSVEALALRVAAEHPGRPITQVGFDRDPGQAWEFYYAGDGLDYVDPFTGDLRPSDSVPLHQSLHKGVEQWHRFFGFKGDGAATAKLYTSWFNLALIPLLLTGLILWWPARLKWPFVRNALLPAGGKRGKGSLRSWHIAIGFWSLPFMLIMVLTATPHSFDRVRYSVKRFGDSEPQTPGSHDSLWPPNLPKRTIPGDGKLLSLDDLRLIADREMPEWTRLDIFPTIPPESGEGIGSVRLKAMAPGWGPSFFPVTTQVDPYSGEVLDQHSWEDMRGGNRLLAWSRWLHKGEAFGRFGQIIAGLASLVFLGLIASGWTLAIRRLNRARR